MTYALGPVLGALIPIEGFGGGGLVGHCLSSLLVVSLWSGATALGFGGS